MIYQIKKIMAKQTTFKQGDIVKYCGRGFSSLKTDNLLATYVKPVDRFDCYINYNGSDVLVRNSDITVPSKRYLGNTIKHNPYLDLNWNDQTKKVESYTKQVLAQLDNKDNHAFYAELIADFLAHWDLNTGATPAMIDFKNKKIIN